MIAKGNQPALQREIENAFAGSRGFSPYARRKFAGDRRVEETVEPSRDRVEHRRLTSPTVLNDHLDWPGVRQILRPERRTIRDGRETSTVQYAITSVDRRRANAADLLRWWRGRWAIENTAFRVRDMTFDEDRNRIRSGRSADTFGRVLNAAMNALRALGSTNLAATLREHAFKVDRLLTRLGIVNQ